MNRFEQLARCKKVEALLVTARARKITAVRVANDGWVRDMLIACTPEVTAASDETWRCLVAALVACERLETLQADFLAEIQRGEHEGVVA